MRKRIIALFLALIMTVGLLPTVALATEGDTPVAGTSSDVKNGYYEGTTWKEGTLNQGTLPTGVVSVSKTAKKVEGKENEYEVKLEVVLKKTESQEKPGAAATVLVLDHSGSMNGCSYCKSTTDDGVNYYHTKGCKYGKGKKVTSEQSRMSAATEAVKDFIKTYSGRFDENGQETTIADLNLGRWVCLVWFNETGGVTGGSKWVDVSNKSGYQSATNTSSWRAHDGTNLDCGLRLADYQLKQKAEISKNLKNVVVLSDGKPTYHLSKSWEFGDSILHHDITIDDTGYYVHGNGGSCDEDTYNTTKSTAATLRNSASVYTVCFGASKETIKDYDKNGNQTITVGDYLKQKIATQPKSGANEKFAYNAADADALNTAFAAISKTIVSGLSTGTVKDTLPTGISSTVFGEDETVMNWELNSTEFTKTEQTRDLGGGKKETVFTYTKTYTVTIDPDDEKLVKTEDGYAPLNGETTLTVKNSQGTDVEIPFPIPAGKVTPTTFTVTWKSQNGETTYETDANVEKNSKPSFDQADPTKTEDDMYTYTFVGWATSANQDTGTPEADLPSVIDNVTYYAAFSKTQKTYTVTGTIDNGTVNNEASTDTQTVNAGESSTAMVFTPAAGYKIVSVTEQIGSNQATNITNFAETGYTYPVQNSVKANITVDVKTAKRSDLKYVVKHVEKDNATNVLATRDKTGTLDEVIHGEAQKENFTGFTYAECSPESIKISATEDNNVITLYYTKNKHNITYVYAEGSPTNAPSLELYNETDILYGAPKTRKGAPTLDGWTFNGWTTENVEVAADGTFSMPDKDVTFTGSWTQRATATINYVVVPNGAGTLSSYSETKYVDDTTDATGSSATPADDYRFVGWYAEEACSTLLSTNSQYTPTKTGDHWTSAIYYAKFEAIPKPDADDLPKVAVICTNDVMGHDASNTELTGSTYTVGRTRYENGVYTCKVTLNQTQGHIDTYNASNPGHTDDATNANVEEITLTYDAARQTWTKSADTFKIYVVCNTTKFDVTYNWTGLDGATFESAVKPELPLKAKVTKGGKHTVDTGYKAGDIRVATNGDKYRFSGWSTTDASIVSGEITNIQNNIALIGEWTKLGNGTFDLNNKILKSFNKKTNSRDIPGDKKYTFEVTVTRLDKENNNQKTDEVYTGTVTLNGATDAAAFVFNNRITFHTGDEYRFLVEETPNTVTTLSSDEQIDYDDAVYYLYVTVSDDLKTINYRFDHVVVITSAEEEPAATENQPITFRNYYDAEKDPDKLYLDFSKYVQKELTATGSKTANDVKFRVIVNGMESPYMMYNVGEEEVSTYAAFDPKYSTVLNVNFASITGGNTETEWFIADNSIVIDQAGIYYFELNEEDGKRTGVTYDDSIYKVLVYVERKDDKLVVKSFDIMKDNVYVDGDTITFHNTIDTGKDDYYPIIIPTIINKDTGMLNKTDHFAYVIGYPDGTVHPNGQITRAEVATIFFRLLRDEVRDGAFTTSNTYSDVAYGKWYNNPISTMSALGIITGYPDGTFKPNKPITRAEFAAIAARFDETQSGKSATFSDVIGHWAAKEIGIAYYNDWIKGYPDGTFKPDQNITRAEAMTMINRVLERKPESPADLLTNMNKWTDNMDTSKWYYLDVQEATNSHGYTRKTFNYELWRQMLPDPDWSRYER